MMKRRTAVAATGILLGLDIGVVGYAAYEQITGDAYDRAAHIVSGNLAYTSDSLVPQVDKAALEAQAKADSATRLGYVGIIATAGSILLWPKPERA